MRKVTKRLLAVCVAAFALGACQDSVQVIQPEPPPPPPPPPAVDATVSILGLNLIPGPGSANPTAVAGDINVSLNVEEGDNTVTAIDLLFDGTPFGCQQINTNMVPGEGVSLSTAGGADVVECFWNTDDVQGTCEGSNLPPAFANGTHELGARITLDDGTTRTASNTQTVTLVNGSFILLATQFDMPATIGTNGRPYWGGPEDRDGDGTDDNVNAFVACPVSYNGTVVGTLSAVATTDGPVAADLGSGLGAVDTDSSEPFVWTLDSGDNDTVEDDPATGLVGHTVSSTGSVFDDAGLNVTAEFAHGSVGGNQSIYLDFTAPAVAAGAEITVGGAVVAGGEYYSSGSYGLMGVSDAGVGFSVGTGATIAVGDCSVADNADNDATTAFTAVDMDREDVSSIDDLLEDDSSLGDDGFGNADAGGVDCYVGETTNLEDDLGNAVDLATVLAGDAINTGDPATFHGADRTEAVTANPEPDPATQPFVLNPDDENDGVLDGVDDFILTFDAADAVLESGDPGSSIDEAGCLVVQGCTAVVADVNAGPSGSPATVPVGNNGTLSTDKGGADDDFIVDIGNSIAMLADGTYEIEVTIPDLAVPTNDATLVFSFDLDNTPPAFSQVALTPGNQSTSGTSVLETWSGQITDAHEIVAATLRVFVDGTDADGTGEDGVCDAATDFELSVASGDIDRNAIDVADGTNTINFNEVFEIFEPAAPVLGDNLYCFFIDADDNAMHKDGSAAPNSGFNVSQAVITW